MPTKRSLSPTQERWNEHVPFRQSEPFSQRFCKSCSDDALPMLKRVLTAEDTNYRFKDTPRRIGNIVTAIETEDACTICKFFVQTTQLRLSDGSFHVDSSRDSRQNSIYIVNDKEPWFHKIGVTAELPPCPFVWLRIGSDDDQPLICITLQQEPQQLSHSGHHRLYPTQRPLLEAFNGSVDLQRVKKWLSKCKANHDRCHQADFTQLPDLTVIDVETRKLSKYIKGGRYIALSYVWGHGAKQQAIFYGDALQRSQTGQSSLDGLTLPPNLPRTIEDTITVAKALEVRYVWVDLFCIDQTNEIEKHEQIEAMDQIYAAAWLTVVSVDGPAADYGLPGVSRHLLQTRQPKVQTPFGCLMATYIDSLWENNGTSQWDSRAWTLQERLLSHRCLFFADTYYAMSCKQEQFHDLVDINILVPEIRLEQQDSYFREDGSSINLDIPWWNFEQYGNFVSVFTGRKITDQNDIHNACWGALNRISSSTSAQFHHGLPKTRHRMLDSLLWMPHYQHVLKRRTGFPSWSWLGWIGRCEFAYWLHFQHSEFCPHKLPDERRRRKDEIRFETSHSGKAAVIVHDDQLTAPVIQLRTMMRSFDVRCLRTSGTLHRPSPSKPEEEAVGDHWALIKHDKSDLLNKVGEYQDFENTATAFRLGGPESVELIKQKHKVDVIFIKYWPHIWDRTTVLSHLVSALVVVKDKNGSYRRLASVILDADEWLMADLHDVGITLI